MCVCVSCGSWFCHVVTRWQVFLCENLCVDRHFTPAIFFTVTEYVCSRRRRKKNENKKPLNKNIKNFAMNKLSDNHMTLICQTCRASFAFERQSPQSHVHDNVICTKIRCERIEIMESCAKSNASSFWSIYIHRAESTHWLTDWQCRTQSNYL